MGSEVEVADGGLSIRHPDGRFQRVKTPFGFTDSAFRGAVAAFDTAFRLNGVYPTVEDIYKLWKGLSKKALATLFLTDEFKKALQYRGIDWDSDSGLSTEQQMVLLKLSDPFDKRSLAVKLREMSIPMPTFQNWQKNPLFQQAYEQNSIANYKDALPAIRNRVIGQAEAGERWATELIFAKTGEWDPSRREIENASMVIQALVEAIVRRVPDAEVRKAIMADVGLSAATLQAMKGPQPLEM